jgi:hypothetical protein
MKARGVFHFMLFMVMMGLVAAPAWADSTLTNIVDLSFGTFGLANNNTPQTIVLTPGGMATYGAKIVDGPIPPKAGEYLLEGLTPDTLLDITVDNTILTRVDGGSPAFTISDYTTNNPTTDEFGNATLFVGATLTTSGTGIHYESGAYAGTMDITIIF